MSENENEIPDSSNPDESEVENTSTDAEESARKSRSKLRAPQIIGVVVLLLALLMPAGFAGVATHAANALPLTPEGVPVEEVEEPEEGEESDASNTATGLADLEINSADEWSDLGVPQFPIFNRDSGVDEPLQELLRYKVVDAEAHSSELLPQDLNREKVLGAISPAADAIGIPGLAEDIISIIYDNEEIAGATARGTFDFYPDQPTIFGAFQWEGLSEFWDKTVSENPDILTAKASELNDLASVMLLIPTIYYGNEVSGYAYLPIHSMKIWELLLEQSPSCEVALNAKTAISASVGSEELSETPDLITRAISEQCEGKEALVSYQDATIKYIPPYLKTQVDITAGDVDLDSSLLTSLPTKHPDAAISWHASAYAKTLEGEYLPGFTKRDLLLSALEDIDNAISISPSPESALLAMKVHLLLGQNEEAEDLWNRFKNTIPDNVDLQAAKGTLAFHFHDYQEAEKAFRTAQSLPVNFTTVPGPMTNYNTSNSTRLLLLPGYEQERPQVFYRHLYGSGDMGGAYAGYLRALFNIPDPINPGRFLEEGLREALILQNPPSLTEDWDSNEALMDLIIGYRDFELGEKVLQTAPPTYKTVDWWRGIESYYNGDYEQSLKYFEAYGTVANQFRNKLRIGALLRLMGDNQGAVNALSDLQLRNLSDVINSLQGVGQKQDVDHAEILAAMNEQGIAYTELGDQYSALSIFENLYKAQFAYLERGSAPSVEPGTWKFFTDPDIPDIVKSGVIAHNYAVVAAENGLEEEAAEASEYALKCDPKNPLFADTNGYATLLLARNESDSQDSPSENAPGTAETTTPTTDESDKHESDAKKDPTKAYEKALAIDPTAFIALNNTGVAEYEAGNLEEAITYFRKAVGARSDYALAWSNLSFALAERGTLKDTIASQGAWGKAVKHAPALRDAADLGIRLDEEIYDSGLDLSQPVPQDWAYSDVRQTTGGPIAWTAIIAGFLLVVRTFLKGLGWDKVTEKVLGHQIFDSVRQNRKHLKAKSGKLARALSIVSVAVAILIALAILWFNAAPSGPVNKIIHGAVLGFSTLLMIAPVLVRKLLATDAAVIKHFVWWGFIIVTSILAIFRLSFIPVPMMDDLEDKHHRIRVVGLIVVGITALVLLLTSWLTDVALTRTLAVIAMAFLSSALIPVRPVDGGFLRQNWLNLITGFLVMFIGVAIDMAWI